MLGYFRVQSDAKRVHRFLHSCKEAVSDLLEAARSEKAISTWFNAGPISQIFEQDIPWCKECCFEEMVYSGRIETSVKTPELREGSG